MHFVHKAVILNVCNDGDGGDDDDDGNDPKETAYLFQQLSVALQRENAVSFQNTFAAS